MKQGDGGCELSNILANQKAHFSTLHEIPFLSALLAHALPSSHFLNRPRNGLASLSPLLQLPGGRASATLLAGDVRLVVIFFQDELVSDAYHSSCHGSCTWRQEGNNPKITTDICSQAETTLPCHTVAKPQKKLSTGAVKGNGVSWGCQAQMQMGGTRGRQLELAGFGEGRGARLKHRGANHSLEANSQHQAGHGVTLLVSVFPRLSYKRQRPLALTFGFLPLHSAVGTQPPAGCALLGHAEQGRARTSPFKLLPPF